MSPEEVSKYIRSNLIVLREDIARAKTYLLKLPSGRAESYVRTWLKDQGIEEPQRINTQNKSQIEELIRTYSLRKAFYQALFELVVSGDMILTEQVTKFQPSIAFDEGDSQYMRTTWEAQKYDMDFAEPHAFQRITLPNDMPTDPDIFLEGVDCRFLHSGIREAVEQSLACFRRGLYLPATAMLAAAAEATWIECGVAVAARLGDENLSNRFADQYSSISKKVTELRKALELANSKNLLRAAGQTSAKVN